MSDLTAATIESVLAEHEADDRESGYYCRCGWVSELWTHGETRAAHRAHVAKAAAARLAAPRDAGGRNV